MITGDLVFASAMSIMRQRPEPTEQWFELRCFEGPLPTAFLEEQLDLTKQLHPVLLGQYHVRAVADDH